MVDANPQLKHAEVALRRAGWPGHPAPKRYIQHYKAGDAVVYEAPVASWRVIRAHTYHRLCRWLHTPFAYKLFGVR